jgi:hypothetical protein
MRDRRNFLIRKAVELILDDLKIARRIRTKKTSIASISTGALSDSVRRIRLELSAGMPTSVVLIIAQACDEYRHRAAARLSKDRGQGEGPVIGGTTRCVSVRDSRNLTPDTRHVSRPRSLGIRPWRPWCDLRLATRRSGLTHRRLMSRRLSF